MSHPSFHSILKKNEINRPFLLEITHNIRFTYRNRMVTITLLEFMARFVNYKNRLATRPRRFAQLGQYEGALGADTRSWLSTLTSQYSHLQRLFPASAFLLLGTALKRGKIYAPISHLLGPDCCSMCTLQIFTKYLPWRLPRYVLKLKILHTRQQSPISLSSLSITHGFISL